MPGRGGEEGKTGRRRKVGARSRNSRRVGPWTISGPTQAKDKKSWLVARWITKGGGCHQSTRRADLRDAEQVVLGWIMEAERCVPVEMHAAIDALGDSMRARGCRDSTIQLVKDRLRPFQRLVDNVQDLKRQHVEARLRGEGRADDRKHQELSVATRRAILKEVKRAAEYWRERGWLGRDPTKGIKIVGVGNASKPVLTRPEARRLSDVLLEDSRPASTAVLMALWLGLRSGEIRDLTVRCVDLDVDPSRGEEPTVTVIRGKTAAAARTLPLPEPLPGRLAVLIDGRDWGDYVFPGERKNPDGSARRRGRKWLIENTRRFCQRAKLAEETVAAITAHGLRGTFKGLALDGGAAIHAAAAALGHANVAVTRKNYNPAADDRAGVVSLRSAGKK